MHLININTYTVIHKADESFLQKLMFIEYADITGIKTDSFIYVHLRNLSQLDWVQSIQGISANDKLGKTCRKGDG